MTEFAPNEVGPKINNYTTAPIEGACCPYSVELAQIKEPF
jgi:hypothetical protein